MRLALVVPRYGAEIGGGAEGLGRWAAEWLGRRHEVTVLTTCALDYRTWEDHYPAGESAIGGVRVRRFRVPVPRHPARFNAWYDRVAGRHTGIALERRWMREQGPNAPGLLAHLGREGGAYDAVLFVPYLYATTYDGLPLVADRSVLLPALHDEPAAWLALMARTYALTRGLAFSTAEERDVCLRRFGPLRADSRLVGVGVPEPPRVPVPERGGRPYVLYLGRLDPSKGIEDLLGDHAAAVAADRRTPRLVAAGRVAMEVPRRHWLEVRGFVDEAEKHELLAGAAALVLPSPYESLSLAVLEAWSHGRPVLVSDRSPVLVGQVRRASGGLWYGNRVEYGQCLAWLGSHPSEAATLGRQGRRYTRGRFAPEAVGRRLEGLVTSVADVARTEP